MWRNNDKVFGVWDQISGTEARSMSNADVIDLLENRGMKRIRKSIDDNNFETGKEYKYWESAS